MTNVKGKKMKVQWKKNTSVTGYKIRYTTDKNLKKGFKTVTIKKNATQTTTISKLTKGKTYYVQIQTYKGKLTSAWSGAKKVTIKQ